MTYDDLNAQIVLGLTASKDRQNGRRIVLYPTAQGWRLGYALPVYGPESTPAAMPKGFVPLDYLSLDRGGKLPMYTECIFEALGLAVALYTDVTKREGVNPALLSIWDDEGQLYPLPVGGK